MHAQHGLLPLALVSLRFLHCATTCIDPLHGAFSDYPFLVGEINGMVLTSLCHGVHLNQACARRGQEVDSLATQAILSMPQNNKALLQKDAAKARFDRSSPPLNLSVSSD